MAPNKSSGPHGFMVEYFIKYWHIVGNVTYRAIKAFFHSCKMLTEANHTFIALIPKNKNPQTSNDFRPISLYNTTYKIIAKILANRLKSIIPKKYTHYIPKIIHPLQGAFVPERDIQDNTLLANEIFHSFKSKRGKGGWLAIKLNVERLMTV